MNHELDVEFTCVTGLTTLFPVAMGITSYLAQKNNGQTKVFILKTFVFDGRGFWGP